MTVSEYSPYEIKISNEISLIPPLLPIEGKENEWRFNHFFFFEKQNLELSRLKGYYQRLQSKVKDLKNNSKFLIKYFH